MTTFELAIEKWQRKIDNYLMENRLKLAMDLSEKANDLIMNSKLVLSKDYAYGAMYHKLIFRHKNFDWVLSHRSELNADEIIISKEKSNSELFTWTIGRFKENWGKQYTSDDLKTLQELINPVYQQIERAAIEIQQAYYLDCFETLKQKFLTLKIEDIEKTRTGLPLFVFNDGSKIPANVQLNEIVEEKEKKILERDYYGRIVNQ